MPFTRNLRSLEFVDIVDISFHRENWFYLVLTQNSDIGHCHGKLETFYLSFKGELLHT